MKKSIAILLSLLFVLANALPSAAISTIGVKSITLNTDKVTMKVGQISNLKVAFTPENTTQKNLRYIISNKNVATINSDGQILGVHTGNTIITVYTADNKVNAKCKVFITPTTLTMFVDAVQNQDPNLRKGLDDYEKATGNRIQYNPILGPIQDVGTKKDIVLMSGDTTDIIAGNAVEAIKYSGGNIIIKDLDKYFKQQNFDSEAVFGDALFRDNEQNIVGLPTEASKWAVFYNKKIFDDAHVPYPKAPWTWDDYIATAKKLTDSNKGIFGSYMPVYDNIMYFKASMAGLSGYKADGTSDYDNPLFKDSLVFYNNLSAVEKVQPSWLEQKVKKMASTYFLSGKCAMMLISDWYLSSLCDQSVYPRDWKVGIVSTPTFKDLKVNRNPQTSDFVGINTYSKNKDVAANFIAWYSQNIYKYRMLFPSMTNVKKYIVDEIFRATEKGTNGELTVDDLYKAYYDNGMKIGNEKILGQVASQYSSIIQTEGSAYIAGAESAEDAVKAIKKNVDDAIKQAKLSK